MSDAPWVSARAAEILARWGGRVSSRIIGPAYWRYAKPKDVELLDVIPADGRWHRLTHCGLGRWDGRQLTSPLRMLPVSRLSWLLGRPSRAEYRNAFTYGMDEPS